MRYKDTLSVLFEALDQEHALGGVTRGLVVRDLRGRVRLVLDWEVSATKVDDLGSALSTKLGDWFYRPILHLQRNEELKRFAQKLFERAAVGRPEWDWTYVKRATGATVEVPNTWTGLQQTLSKQSWLGTHVSPPWPLLSKTPSIVSFYSYKGGVGRSTLLGLVATRLAARGEKVVVVDLDLEAPGQHRLFVDNEVEDGVLDFLAEHLATGRARIDGLVRRLPIPIQMPSQPGHTPRDIDVLPAGRVGAGTAYLEMLARLDYVSNDLDGRNPARSPVELALRDLLKQVRQVHTPDWILLDARTGLHDLGGLALHALGHIDVLIGRANQQDYEGLSVAIELLSRRSEAVKDGRLVLVQNMLATDPDLREKRLSEAREHFYAVARRSLWRDENDNELPTPDDHGIHQPIPISFDAQVSQASSLAEIDPAFLSGEGMNQLVSSIDDLRSPEDADSDETDVAIEEEEEEERRG